MSASLDAAKVLLEEHRRWHQELVNASRPDPRVWNVGDIVFARRQTRSHKGREIVGKLQYAHTGPWRVLKRLEGASYELEHCQRAGITTKKHASHLSPFPLPLIPFEPVDGPDNQYDQINRPIGKQPYEQAGISGFEPLQPFKLPPSANLALMEESKSFRWPSLSELNDELIPFPWTSGEKEALDEYDDDEVVTHPALYTGPPPTMLKEQPPRVPSVEVLALRLIQSSDRLFFISHEIQLSSRREWRLVRVHLEDSMALRPSCLTDGRYLVEFYILHEADVRYNATNQRYWLQYHAKSDLVTPNLATETHFIRPSDTSEQLAARHNLLPSRQWVTLVNDCTYIHGPFDFAAINGRQSHDRVDISDWNVLHAHKSMYSNQPPSLELPTYSIHVDNGVHVAFGSQTIAQTMMCLAQQNSEIGEPIIR